LEPLVGFAGGLGGVDQEGEARVGVEFEFFVGDVEFAQVWVADLLLAAAVDADVAGGPLARNTSLRSASSSMGSWKYWSAGSWPVSARMMATLMSAASSQSGMNRSACSRLRKMNRARLPSLAGSEKTSV
jgi:hypothetical protein